MTTFAGWLNEQSGRDDATGQIARLWASTEGKRPRMSSPSTIERWMVKEFPDNSEAISRAFHAVVDEWRAIKSGRPLQAVSDGFVPGQGVVMHTTAQSDADQLNRIEALLLAVAERAGVTPEGIADAAAAVSLPVQQKAAELGFPGWERLAELADYSAETGEQG